jgi:hypothetical protein
MLWTSSSSLTFSKQINCTRTEALNLFYDHEAFILLNGLAVSVEKISDDGTIAKFKFTERPVLFGPIKATITPTSTICRVEDGQDVHTKAPMGVQVWLKWRVQTIADGGIEVNAAVTAEVNTHNRAYFRCTHVLTL